MLHGRVAGHCELGQVRHGCTDIVEETRNQPLQLDINKPLHGAEVFVRGGGGLQTGYHIGAELALGIQSAGYGEPRPAARSTRETATVVVPISTAIASLRDNFNR